MCPPTPEKHYNPQGRYIEHQRAQTPRRGLLGGLSASKIVFPNEQQPWTEELLHKLVTRMLTDDKACWEFQTHKDGSALCHEYGRSFKSIDTRLGKIAGNYREGSRYKPLDAPSRAGLPFTAGDRFFRIHAFGEWDGRTATNARRLAAVLRRPLDEVTRWCVRDGFLSA